MLKHRLLTGSILGSCAILAFAWPGWIGVLLFSALALAFVTVGTAEFIGLVRKLGWSAFGSMNVAAGAVLFLAIAIAGVASDGDAAVLAWSQALVTIAVVLVLVIRALIVQPPELAITKLLMSLAAYLYVSWPLAFLAQLYFAAGMAASGRLLAVYLVAVTKLADVGAYAVGTLASKRPGGNHPLAPGVSPKKSWEGLAGGILTSVVSAVVLWVLLRDHLVINGRAALALRDTILVGCAAAVLGLIGDLLESLFKRAAGAKDSGALPGLGGVLDVADSLIPMAPLFYLLVRYNTGF